MAIVTTGIAISVIAVAEAQSQVVCDGPNPSTTNVTCTNNGNTGPFGAQTSSGSATSINFETGTAIAIGTTANGGNALTNNAGQTVQITTDATDGNATTINTRSGFILLSTTTFSQNGVATTQNEGTVGGYIVTNTLGGDAVTTNSGTVLNQFSFPGSAITTATDLGGNATTINSGTVYGGTATSTGSNVGGDGNAKTVNFGAIIGPVTTTSGTFGGSGDATTNNYGVINGDIYNSAADGGFGTGNALLSNSGAIVTNFGGSGVTVLASSGDATFVNSGKIDASGGLPSFAIDTGIFVGSMDGNASAHNTGAILGGIAVVAGDFATATLTNAGLIDGTKSPFGIAIDMFQLSSTANSTLNIMPGSRILGSILLEGGFLAPPTTVNIFSGRDVSSVLTFGDTCGCGGLIESGAPVNVFGGAPYVISGNTVAVLDPTSFTNQDRNVLDFTHTVLSAASSRLTSPAPLGGSDSTTAIGFAPSGNVARDMRDDAFANIPALSYASQDRVLRSNPTFTAADGTSVWAQGFGGVRVQNADGPNLRSVNQFYGGLLGADKVVKPGIRVGGFVGGGNISSQIDMNSGSTTSDVGFGGVYGRYAMQRAFLDFALIAGGSSNDVKRTMTNNLVAGGYEYAHAYYGGWFVSPELAYGVRQDLTKSWTVTPTARVRYLAANFGGYQESGSSTNLTVAGRTSHNFEERGELVFTRTTNERDDSVLQINATVGGLAWQRAGGTNVNTVLLGQALAFNTPGQANVFGGYVGGGFDWRQTSGVSIFGATELTFMSDSSHTLTGRGGVKVLF